MDIIILENIILDNIIFGGTREMVRTQSTEQ